MSSCVHQKQDCLVGFFWENINSVLKSSPIPSHVENEADCGQGVEEEEAKADALA